MLGPVWRAPGHGRVTLLDEYFAAHDASERHLVRIAVPPAAVFAALRLIRRAMLSRIRREAERRLTS